MEQPEKGVGDVGKSPPAILRVEQALAALAMGLLCVITFANVVTRYFTNISFAFTEEISVFLLVFLTLMGASSAFATDKQISITILVERLPAIGRKIAGWISSIACIAMFALLVWYGIRLAYDDFRYEVTSPGLGVPQWLYTGWLPLLSVVILVRLMALAVSKWRRDR